MGPGGEFRWWPHIPNYLHELNFRLVISLGVLANRSMSWSGGGQQTRKEKGDETE